ncbi:MAG: tRNA (adenosine(37)-N6)-dimethylallyltransferase MiaA [Butyrivibrio sp.]|nr:tRNA (adenosine(37)-N6)-dimethylallyltransferase MiaA [Butyrivibrio sp.]
MNDNGLIVVTGPTAVGKTKLSIELAKRINGEIISADSMQVYKGMNIGTDKITQEQMDGVRHHLIDILDTDEDFNVFTFKKLADEAIADIKSRGRVPIIVGGTGFYIQAVLYDIDFTETDIDETYRHALEEIARTKGAEFLHEELRKVDPASADSIHANNVKRVIRALEYYNKTGEQISKHNEEERQKKSPYDFRYFVLTDDREVLYSRIDVRVDKMIEEGLEDEMKSLINKGIDPHSTAMQGLGYREMYDYVMGNIDLERAVYLIKRNTRHFAKRQLTWFKREKDVRWINKKEFGRDDKKVLEEIIRQINE